MAEASASALRVEHISKNYGAVTALRDVSLGVKYGEALGLIGDNGAGKSTLIKIMTGYTAPTSGAIYVNEEQKHLHSVNYARSLGIETVYQDLAMISELSVFHNMFLKRELLIPRTPFLDNHRMKREAQEFLLTLGVKLPSVDVEVSKLSGGQRQAVAIARALFMNAKILLLDEPLAAMGAREGAAILELINNLKKKNVAIIMIGHNYAQVLEVCDRINLLQRGVITYDKIVSSNSMDELNDIIIREYRIDQKQAESSAAADGANIVH